MLLVIPKNQLLAWKRVAFYLLVSVLLALAPPPARREPLDEEEPSESEDELLMLSLSWPLPQDVAAQPPRSGRRLRVGELSEVVSGALLSMLAMPVQISHSVKIILLCEVDRFDTIVQACTPSCAHYCLPELQCYQYVSSSAEQVSPNSAGCIHSEPPAPVGWELWLQA